MGHLGVSLAFSREQNLEIIKQKFMENPAQTKAQVNFLSRFPAFGHIKGKEFPECQCLRCEGLKLIRELENGQMQYVAKPIEQTVSSRIDNNPENRSIDNEWKV